MEKLKFNPGNKKYYSEEFIKGFECGVERQYAEDVVSIKQIINEIDELYYDFENSDGNLTTFIIDGEILHTDVGYAIVGIEFYKNILKKRIGKYCGAKMEEAEEK
jgi:hypothetical protein